ncbi:acyl-CoA synthetase (AMP-forming)/AMP-acid ligase II [Amycolatopsis lexingtonensis]|uniref:Acyl-CoA synthetase (AMP-forming)/AMP-acid ligase II n=1 Tax=Amycolatopsis lexingtonensis TaxID=218822 RepID=A0ABR9IED0_9PSEU|nr:AMP-binding protein [Amycolatopsis lexingtonensis]MBE1501536.1 acyl-CoA synthetase (AMP-forming)/AMP-acid ligase II [Amycolatopsis lexingtonensis]
MLTSSERAAGGLTAAAGATTLSTLLTARAAAAGGERALTRFGGAGGRTVTWAGLDDRVTAVAAALRQVTEPGQRAAIVVADPVECVVAFLGVLRAGLVAIPVGPDRARVLGDAEPVIVLATSATVAATRQFLSTLDTCGHRVLAVDAVPEAPGFVEDPVAAEDVAYLQYPGGVMVTHANVVANARQAAAVLGPGALVSRLPLSDPLGLLLGVAVPLTTGRSVVLVERLESIASLGSVTTLVSLADPDLERVREAFAGAGQLRECYSVPEATALVACGHPAGQRVAIVSPDGRRLAAGEAGEIWVSGPNVARGYRNRPEESARVFCAFLTGDDEPRWWLRTGHLGVLDESGELAVLDDDFAAGHHPRDLEATAGEAHPAVRDAAAFAVPGAQVVLVVELAAGIVPPRGAVERAVRGALSARHGLTPRRVVVLGAGELPPTRAECRERYLAGLPTPDGLR